MKARAIIGIGFGDCGKGIATDYLCSQSSNPIVIRYSGGQQAGHTVYFNDNSHVFSNFGSGTLRGIPTYWSKYCTLDPVGVVNELGILLQKGINPKLYIDAKCPVTTDFDKLHDKKYQKKTNHGSCGVGVGSTIKREEMKYSLTFFDLFYPSILRERLSKIANFYNVKYDTTRFVNACSELIKSLHIELTHNLPDSFDDYIYEGSQGLLLDMDYGFFPHVTRSNTGTKNILKMCEQPDIFLITRAYQTRHGNGFMTNENIPHNIKLNPNETNIKNEYQGEFRRSLLDTDLLLYAINKDDYIRNDKNKSLIITCLDHIENEHRFTHKENIIYCDNESDFVMKLQDILQIKYVYISKSPYSENIRHLA
jgi:adenylosuccinate synthase